jgi:hypothetical protein
VSRAKVILPFLRIDVCLFGLISTRSLDHLIGPIKHRLRNRETDLLRGFQIDDELELLRLFHGEVSGLRAFQYLVYIGGSTPIILQFVGCI